MKIFKDEFLIVVTPQEAVTLARILTSVIQAMSRKTDSMGQVKAWRDEYPLALHLQDEEMRLLQNVTRILDA